MAEITLKVEERKEFGKNVNRRLRQQGLIPGVVYGTGLDNWCVVVNPKQLTGILESDSGRNTILSIQTGAEARDVVIKDYQLDPVKGTLLHVDFQKIDLHQKMSFQVPIELVGDAVGVNEGGMLDVVQREIEVECLPGDVPDQIQVDIEEMNVGDSIRVADVKIDRSKVTVLADPDAVLVTISAPRAEVEAEVEEEIEGTPEAAGEAESADEAGSEE